MHAHKNAGYAIRNFWKLILSHEISFRGLNSSFKDIQAAQSKAEKTYKMILERYPTSVKVLRAYAKFLEDIKNDPWTAVRFYRCACTHVLPPQGRLPQR